MFSELIEEYLQDNSSHIPSYLIDLENQTHRNVLKPQMISGRVQGRLLSVLSKLKNPSRILEIGTFTGYSALCLAEGLTQNGKLISLEVNDELELFHEKHLNQNPLSPKIEVVYCEASEYLMSTEMEAFDIIFIDANKKSYPKYLELCYPLLNEGGLLLADNVLWYDKVVDNAANDKETVALRNFNRIIRDHPSLHSFILPFRDGLTIAHKKEVC